MCLLAIWSAQSFKRKLSFSVDLGLFQLSLSTHFHMIVAFLPVAVIRGSPRGFPALLGWKRHLNRTNILDRTFSSFSRYFLFRKKQASKLGRRAGRSRSSAALEKRNKGNTKPLFSNLIGLALYSIVGIIINR